MNSWLEERNRNNPDTPIGSPKIRNAMIVPQREITTKAIDGVLSCVDDLNIENDSGSILFATEDMLVLINKEIKHKRILDDAEKIAVSHKVAVKISLKHKIKVTQLANELSKLLGVEY